MVYPDTFTGFQVESAETWLQFHKNEFQPKPFGDFDVDIKIQACGVCGSDVHTLSGGWGEQHYPLCCGHGTASYQCIHNHFLADLAQRLLGKLFASDQRLLSSSQDSVSVLELSRTLVSNAANAKLITKHIAATN
jgi:hypothetical protein